MSNSEVINEKTIRSIFDQHYPPLCGFANKYVKDMDASRDIVQNVFIKLWEKRQELDTSQLIKPYLYRSVMNLCLNYLRDNKKLVHHELPTENDQLVEYLDSSNKMELSELQAKIQKAISKLPEKPREVFTLSRNEGKSYKEIAELLDIGVKAVEANMTRALKKLRKDLIEYLMIILIFSVGY